MPSEVSGRKLISLLWLACCLQRHDAGGAWPCRVAKTCPCTRATGLCAGGTWCIIVSSSSRLDILWELRSIALTCEIEKSRNCLDERLRIYLYVHVLYLESAVRNASWDRFPHRRSAYPWLHVRVTEHDRSALHSMYTSSYGRVWLFAPTITTYAACRPKQMACLLNFPECDCSVIMFYERYESHVALRRLGSGRLDRRICTDILFMWDSRRHIVPGFNLAPVNEGCPSSELMCHQWEQHYSVNERAAPPGV